MFFVVVENSNSTYSGSPQNRNLKCTRRWGPPVGSSRLDAGRASSTIYLTAHKGQVAGRPLLHQARRYPTRAARFRSRHDANLSRLKRATDDLRPSA